MPCWLIKEGQETSLEHAVGETGRAIDGARIRMARGQTGRLRVHIPARGECSIYLLDGEIIAALTDDDPESVVDRLVARGRMQAARALKLKGDPMSGPLSFEKLHKTVDPTLVGRLMVGRFRDNLVFHLFDGGRFVFEHMDSVRVPHLQMGHDSAGLLRELEVVHERIHSWIGIERQRVIGLGEHKPGSPQQRHVQALCSNGLRLDRLIHVSPFFPAQTLVLVAQMVDSGCLTAVENDPGDGPDPGAVSHAIAMAQAQKERRSEAVAVRAENDKGMTSTPEMMVFADHERTDRGLGQGGFSGDRDRVDLSQSAPLKTPGLRLSAPLFQTGEVVRRVGVCNEVLTAFVDVWTDQFGASEARHVAQLLVDGSPLDAVALFRSVEVDSKGRMGASVILKNLQRRPEGERRDLVVKGLSGLIERILTRAAEELDEDRLHIMLNKIAGYRQRMGW